MYIPEIMRIHIGAESKLRLALRILQILYDIINSKLLLYAYIILKYELTYNFNIFDIRLMNVVMNCY